MKLFRGNKYLKKKKSATKIKINTYNFFNRNSLNKSLENKMSTYFIKKVFFLK